MSNPRRFFQIMLEIIQKSSMPLFFIPSRNILSNFNPTEMNTLGVLCPTSECPISAIVCSCCSKEKPLKSMVVECTYNCWDFCIERYTRTLRRMMIHTICGFLKRSFQPARIRHILSSLRLRDGFR